MKTPDILNSKIKKLRIELPHYSFSHSSSGDSPHAFIGRVRMQEKLKKIIEDSPDEPGVYLIAGNRGVGKTNLINKVIKETSLEGKSRFSENLKYLILLFLAVIGTQFCLQIFDIPRNYNTIFKRTSFLVFFSSFILLCFFNDYRYKFPKKTSWVKYITDAIISAFKELSYLNPCNSRKSTQIVLKTILVVSFTQFLSIKISYTPIKVFLSYLAIVFLYMCVDKLRKYIKKKNKISHIITQIFQDSILNPINNYIKNHSRLYLRINFGHKLKDEKDILRLVTRTLSTEYQKYRRSFWRMLPWRVIAFGFLLIFAYLFSGIVELITNWAYSEINSNIINFLFAFDRLVFKISQETEAGKFFYSLGYFWTSLISVYIFCILLFRCNWITHFFVTHRVIMRRLKKLNIDITHSTERENSIGINNEKTGPLIGIKAKKSRNVADAREIEKELQDILNDMQRIPIIMCRPNVVIVFDELDKVESDDAKASMFSINATRDKQTEILRILSNLKYFLSSAKAKFIFIAGHEMYDIHLADVSERNNYIGSIFNAVIYVPSFLTDHPTGKNLLPQESGITSLPEEFVCRRLIPSDYQVKSYDLKSYRTYLEKKIYKVIKNDNEKEKIRQEKIQKIIAVLQQFIIYLAHISKGAPKKMMQLFESFVDIHIEKDENKNTLFVQRYRNSRHFLSFNYYKQYTVGIVAYMMTPIFYRLSESNIKEHSDKLLVSALRFVDFVFKFHKHHFSYKHLDISPEMLEVNRAPELKSVVVDLLNYLSQVHINKSDFSLSEYKFDSLIANEIFAMAKTDDVFSALFSFSLDELSPLKNHYKNLLEKTEAEYRDDEDKKTSTQYIDAISSLQSVLGDLYYYDDGLEEAEAYYKNSVQTLYEKGNGEMTLDQLYAYVRNMLRLGIIYEKRKQYDFAYLTYGEICKRIIWERNIEFQKAGIGVVLRRDDDKIVFVKASTVDKLCGKNRKYDDSIKVPEITCETPVDSQIASLQPLNFGKISPNTYDMLFKKMTFEGLKMLYLPFIAKLQILEQSHLGGITRNHLEQLDKEFRFLTYIIDHKEAKLLEAEFYSRVADILYYKNSDLKDLRCGGNKKNSSCTACYYYHKALSILLNKSDLDKPQKDNYTVKELLRESIEQTKDNYNMKFCTILARILSDWGNIFFSCDTKNQKNKCGCYICDTKDCNTRQEHHCYYNYIRNTDTCETNRLGVILKKYITESEKRNRDGLLKEFGRRDNFTKMEIAFAMYAISLHTYRKANLYKRSAYQIHKMLSLFKRYKIYKSNYIEKLSKKALNYLWRANENLGVFELNKRKKDFDKEKIGEKIPLQNLLVDSEITRMRILVKELGLKTEITPKKLKEYYGLYITSPYRINYSILGRIYRLRLKSKVNYETYQKLIENSGKKGDVRSEIKFILEETNCNNIIKEIFEGYFGINDFTEITYKEKLSILENLIAESIYCLTDIAQLLETMDETYLFPHSLLGSIHKDLSLWIRRYETYEKDFYEKYKDVSRIKKLLKQYLDEEWRELLSGYRENKKALSHYYKCLEMHNEGRAYHNMIDSMCYVRDDYNDRSDHFNIAEERHLIVNGEIRKKIDEIKNLYKDSELYNVDNYFEKSFNRENVSTKPPHSQGFGWVKPNGKENAL